MTLLDFIWVTSLLLMGGALTGIAGLVVARAVSNQYRARKAAHRRLVLPVLMGRETIDHRLTRRLTRRWPGILADLFLEMAPLIRGEEHVTLVARAADLGVPAYLARMARSASAGTRSHALQALAEFNDPETIVVLRAGLEDRVFQVRISAVLALTKHGETIDLPRLLSEVPHHIDSKSRSVAALFQSLAHNDPEQLKAYACGENGNTNLQLAALEALAVAGDFSIAPFLVEQVRSAPADAGELPRYLDILGILGHPAARTAIMAGLANPVPATRVAAATAAGKIKLRESIASLASLLHDGEWWVRSSAAEALLNLGEPGIDHLRRIACGVPGPASEVASSVLQEKGWAQ